MQILIAILALSFLIIVHELGHFTVAKLSGIKVHEFALFMGPKLFSIKKGETNYTLRLVPIGGYVRMEGEEQASEDSRAFNRQPIPVRMAVIAAGPIMNLIVALILVFIVISSSGYNSTVVGSVEKNSAAYMAGIHEGDVIKTYGGKNIFTASDVDLFLFGSKGIKADVVISRNGIRETKRITPEIISKNRYLLGFSPAGSSGIKSRTVDSVSEGSGALKAGVKKGDIFLRLNNTIVNDGKDIRNFLEKNNGKEISVTILHNGHERVIKLTPVRGSNPESYDTGLSFKHLKGGVLENIKQSATYSYSIARTVMYSLSWLITQRVSFKEMSGPVGIVTAIGDVVQYSPTFLDKLLNLINFTALISINLGLFNLIPFPALDGSKLIIYAIEGIRRKAMPPEREALISLIGLALLVMLMIFATFNDVLRMTGKG